MAKTGQLSPQQKTAISLAIVKWIGIVLLAGIGFGSVWLITDTWRDIAGTTTDFKFQADATVKADGTAKLELNSDGKTKTKVLSADENSNSASMNAFCLLFLLAGVAGVLDGLGARKLRQWRVGQVSAQLSKEQRSLDPKKMSSGLLPSGTTNPKDR